MKTFCARRALVAVCLLASICAWADPMRISADFLAADNVTKAMVASGHVHAVSGVMSLRSDSLSRDAEGLVTLSDPTAATTCTNAVGHQHWNVTGEVKYKEDGYVLLRNAWLKFYEIPIFYLPYLYYPLDMKCGFSWMVGYRGKWGAYLMTKYRYHLLGDPTHSEATSWLAGDTRFDLRYKNGVALGENLKWGLGELGKGSFKAYYLWDEYASHRYGSSHDGRWRNWSSDVNRDRYIFEANHRWDVTERDLLRLRGSYYSDTRVKSDFFRPSFLTLANDLETFPTSGIFWEHLEDAIALGAEVDGRFQDFQAATEHLPGVYLNVMPRPLFRLPINYESENEFGYLRRRYAKTGAAERDGLDSPYATNPGLWADYEAVRFDTYHRLTAPFRTFDDTMSVVPRLAWHGTLWDNGGFTSVTGANRAGETDQTIVRSIVEGGVTFAGRATGWVDERWQHVFEPYMDVLVQDASYSGLDSGERPYVFDSIDASRTWEDQFAGRSRNLPYSYYGLTPGLRNAWNQMDDKGHLRQILDFDAYAALQFNDGDWMHAEEGEHDSTHKLAKPGDPNYGDGNGMVVPGARLRWTPNRDLNVSARAEYDSENDRLALASLLFDQKVSKDFDCFLSYQYRDFRIWDFSSSVSANENRDRDDFNWEKHHLVALGFRQQPIDWFAWSPFIRWDIREDELDAVGGWFDYLTDCLGFRFIVEYENDYTRLDGYEYKHDWDVSFQIYLRAFGFGSSSIFGN